MEEPYRGGWCAQDLRPEQRDHGGLQGIDLNICRGEMVGVMGPSGCGKKTLLNTLSGIVRPDGFVGLLSRQNRSHCR